MLHDPSHYEPLVPAEPIRPCESDKTVLRRLAEKVAAIAAEPGHRQKAELCRPLNHLDSLRPMVWINEIPWHEMDIDGELTLRTMHPGAGARSCRSHPSGRDAAADLLPRRARPCTRPSGSRRQSTKHSNLGGSRGRAELVSLSEVPTRLES